MVCTGRLTVMAGLDPGSYRGTALGYDPRHGAATATVFFVSLPSICDGSVAAIALRQFDGGNLVEIEINDCLQRLRGRCIA